MVTEIADVTAGPEEGSIALAKRVYAHLYEGNLSSRYRLGNYEDNCIAGLRLLSWLLHSFTAAQSYSPRLQTSTMLFDLSA